MSASVTFRAICLIQLESGQVVIPAIHTLRGATRMKLCWRSEPTVETSFNLTSISQNVAGNAVRGI